MRPRLSPSGDQCVIVEFGEVIDLAVNARALAFARRVSEAAIAGVVDIVPSHVGVGVHYRADRVSVRSTQSPYDAIAASLRRLLREPFGDAREASPLVEIPVCVGGEHGADLDEAAATLGMGAEALVERFLSTELRVLMIGFAPGQPYLGMLDARLSLPRRKTPRTRVPAGSVAIANGQATIYPFELPGGWHLLGRTPRALFDRGRADDPCLLKPGDRVRFVPLDASAFDAALRAPDAAAARAAGAGARAR
ncbi:MAG: 5-oxoprolinase subunit PxpB [Lautropia sp.]